VGKGVGEAVGVEVVVGVGVTVGVNEGIGVSVGVGEGEFDEDLLTNPKHKIIFEDFYKYETDCKYDTVYGDISRIYNQNRDWTRWY